MENLPTYRLTQSGPEAQEILDQVNLNTIDIEQLKRLYQALTQSDPEIIEPNDTWPVANPEENVIYRVIDRVNTPPQYYSDYMWNGTSMVLMSQYNNAIDNEPTANSNNLVKSGGVYSFVHANGGAYDISAAHAVGGVLATYDDLADALGTNGANVPAAVRKGGMSIKFVLSSDNKYVQYRYMSTSTTNANFANVGNWQGVDEEPTAGSNNLVKSEGVAGIIGIQDITPNGSENKGVLVNTIIHVNVGSIDKSYTTSLNAGKKYVYIGGSNEVYDFTNLRLQVFDSSDNTIYDDHFIHSTSSYNRYKEKNSLFYMAIVELPSDDNYRFKITKNGNAADLRLLIASQPITESIKTNYLGQLQAATKNYAIGLDWRNAYTNGSNSFYFSDYNLSCLFVYRGKYFINWDSSKYKLCYRMDSSYVQNLTQSIVLDTTNASKVSLTFIRLDGGKIAVNDISDINLSITQSLSGSIFNEPTLEQRETNATVGAIVEGVVPEILKNKLYTDLIANEGGVQNLVSIQSYPFLSGDRSRTLTVHLTSGNYKVCIEKPDDAGIVKLILSVDKSSVNYLYTSAITTSNNLFVLNNANYLTVDLAIEEEGDYSFKMSHNGGDCEVHTFIFTDKAPSVLTVDYKQSMFNSTEDQSLLLNWYNGYFNGAFVMISSTTVLCSDLLVNYGLYQISYDDVTYRLRLYTGSELEISNGDIINIDSSIAKQGFLMTKRNGTAISPKYVNLAKLTIKKVYNTVNLNEVAITLENGIFNGGGSDVSDSNRLRTQKIMLTTETLVFATCPENIYIQCNFQNYLTSRRNLSNEICGGLCIKNPQTMIRFGFIKKDSSGNVLPSSSITAEERAQIKVYKLYESKSSEYDILLAAPDSNEPLADFVCSDSNAQFIINALASSIGNINVGFAKGTFKFNKAITTCWGKKCMLQTKGNALNLSAFDIRFSGKDGASFVMTESAYNLLPSDKECAFFTVPNIQKSPFANVVSGIRVSFDNILLYGYNYTKPLVLLDFAWSQQTIVKNFNIRCDYSYQEGNGGLHPFETKPNDGCVGIRVGHGSNNGSLNFVKHGEIFYCGTGLSCCGEHYVFEDVLTHHCYIGWAFGDAVTRTRFEHPNIMIGCSIEHCYRLMRLSKQGITIEGDAVTESTIRTWCDGLTTKSAIIAELESHESSYPWLSQFIDSLPETDAECVQAVDYSNFVASTIICIGLSTESTWDIPIDEREEGEPTTQPTKPILEVLKSFYRGRIELDYNLLAFETGSGQRIHFTTYGGTCRAGIGNTVTETW